MDSNQLFSRLLSHYARLLHRIRYQRPFTLPQKAVIIQPGTLASAMLTTPMIARLRRRFPDTRFDWAGVHASYPAIVGNEDIIQYITIPFDRRTQRLDELAFIRLLQEGNYDSCFIPDHYPRMVDITLRAGIPQRIGLWNQGRGYRFTLPIQTQNAERHRSVNNLALAELESKTIQLTRSPMLFYPSDYDRKSISQRLIDELDWMGERPLVLMYPGCGDEPDERRWPIERYVLMGNRIIRHHQAQLLLLGEQSDFKTCREVAGMIAGDVANWVGGVSIGEIGALAEIADVYIGNDQGATHISAAMGCATIAIFGPTDPGVTAPYGVDEEQITVLWKQSEDKRPFSWQDGVTVADVEKAVNRYLGRK